MRKQLVVATLVFSFVPWISARQAAKPAASPAPMLTIDSIMRGPKLVGNPPSAIRWSRDSSKLYFSWQKAADDRSATYVVSRDGTGLRQMTAEETRAIEAPQTGRFDRARKRMLAAEGGDVVVYDVASGSRRLLTRTSSAETNPRWARNDTAVTFMRDGNLYLVSIEATPEIAFAQLTNIVASDAAQAQAVGAGGGGRGGAGGRGGGGGAGQQGQQATDTESQRFLREQERALIEFIRKQQETGRGGGAATGGRGGGPAAATPAPPPIATLNLTPRQSLLDLQLSADERYVWVSVNERAESTARPQDTPNYVTASSYPEMIPGRSNV
ncbi:MAG TPA: hypothetical protein VMS54_08730, partial [Vicinamibacterales bacterium]|nr:hypothetical protein [Vicinamibacterales bacterium]